MPTKKDVLSGSWVPVKLLKQEEGKARDWLLIKLLELYSPELAAEEYGLDVERPILIAGGHDKPLLIYQRAGQVVESPDFAPSRGIGITYIAVPKFVLTNGSPASRDLQANSWIAIVEPIGKVYTPERNEYFRYVKSVRVEEIRAYCYQCAEETVIKGRNRSLDKRINQGLVVDISDGYGHLKAICGLDKHPRFEDYVTHNFEITKNGEFVLSDTKAPTLERLLHSRA